MAVFYFIRDLVIDLNQKADGIDWLSIQKRLTSGKL